ncbi:hypothetical protein ACWD4V_03565 [Streptomyces tsukubensis]
MLVFEVKNDELMESVNRQAARAGVTDAAIVSLSWTAPFLEVETIVAEADVAAAPPDVRSVLTSLGIDEGDLTRELYTDAVRARR